MEASIEELKTEIERLRQEKTTIVDALRQIGLLANSVSGDSPYLKLNAIANRCSKEVGLYPLPDGRTK